MKRKKENSVNLNKYLASIGLGSRRHCDQVIQKAQVLVNGRIANVGMKIKPDRDQISLIDQGDLTVYRSKIHYLVLNKPSGYLTTMSDPFDRPTIKDLLPELVERIFPVGRLDYNSEGVLLLTNDGDMAYRLTHPSFMISKTYKIKVKGKPFRYKLNKLKKGVKLKDGWASIDSIHEIKTRSTANTWLTVTIHEGRNRLIRRIFDSIEHPVIKLKRISFAGIELGTLRPGQWRYLTKNEIKTLKDKNRIGPLGTE